MAIATSGRNMKEALTNKIMENSVYQNSFLSVDPNKETPEYSIIMSDHSQNFCVGMVDIVNSTRIATMLPRSQIGTYYEIFLNSMAKVLARFGGMAIKNMGDSLLFFFPESSHQNRKYGFMSCLECVLAMAEEHDKISEKLKLEGLPQMDYRVSVDYGDVSVMKSNNNSIDLIGTPVNMCAKINRQAPVNGIVVGGDLYEIAKNFGEYYFKKAQGFSVGLKPSYPIYSVRRKKN